MQVNKEDNNKCIMKNSKGFIEKKEMATGMEQLQILMARRQ